MCRIIPRRDSSIYPSILHKPDLREGDTRFNTQKQDHGLIESIDERFLIQLAQPALERGEKVKAELEIRNVDRTAGTTL